MRCAREFNVRIVIGFPMELNEHNIKKIKKVQVMTLTFLVFIKKSKP
jgi:hypothetical protein